MSLEEMRSHREPNIIALLPLNCPGGSYLQLTDQFNVIQSKVGVWESDFDRFHRKQKYLSSKHGHLNEEEKNLLSALALHIG